MDEDTSSFDARLREIEARYEDISSEMSSASVASDADRLRDLGRAFAELRDIVELYRRYRSKREQAADARELAAAEEDAEMAAFLANEAESSDREADRARAELELALVPKDPNDGKNVVLEIRAGAGGQEAALWAGELLEMYRRYAEGRGWRTEILSASPSDAGGLKDAAVEIRGRDAFSRLKRESGVHRVQRVPATESSGRIHTSTATVAVMPEAEEVEVEIRPEDIELQVYRSSGPGGQSVNTADSAVRITHKPSGIVVTCQEERSQLQNREKAMRYLRARLYRRAQEDAQRREAEERRSQVGTGERAEKIRTYNFPDGRVTDHRVNLTVHRLSDVLAGQLDPFVDALLAADRAAQLARPEADGEGAGRR
jgi:peptide chain release factor 1